MKFKSTNNKTLNFNIKNINTLNFKMKPKNILMKNILKMKMKT